MFTTIRKVLAYRSLLNAREIKALTVVLLHLAKERERRYGIHSDMILDYLSEPEEILQHLHLCESMPLPSWYTCLRKAFSYDRFRRYRPVLHDRTYPKSFADEVDMLWCNVQNFFRR